MGSHTPAIRTFHFTKPLLLFQRVPYFVPMVIHVLLFALSNKARSRVGDRKGIGNSILRPVMSIEVFYQVSGLLRPGIHNALER